MASANKELFAVQRRLDRAENRLKRAVALAKAIDAGPSKRSLFIATCRDLEQLKAGFDADHLELDVSSQDVEGFDPQRHTRRIDEFDDEYYFVLAMRDNLSTEDSSEKKPPVTASQCRSNLPVIKLPTFNGEPKEWNNFSTLFKTIIEKNSGLTDVERLTYLKSSLSGEANSLIQSLPLTEKNYDVAWTTLQTRYENKRLITAQHIDAVLMIPNASSDNPASVRQLLCITTENMSALKAMNLPVDEWDVLLLHILERKLDVALRRQWELSLNTTDPPKLSDFTNFIGRQCTCLETTMPVKSKPVVSRTVLTTPNRSVANRQVSNLATGTSVDLKCLLCSRSHPLFKCSQLLSQTPKERYDTAKRLKVCLNCLKPSHVVKECTSMFSCYKCNSKHHTILHFSDYRESSPTDCEESEHTALNSEDNSTQDTSRAFSATSTTLHRVSEPSVLLSTVQLVVKDCGGTDHVVRGLLDSASEASFISEGCFQRLGLIRKRANLSIHGLNNTSVSRSRGSASFLVKSVHSDTANFEITAFIVPRIAGPLPVAVVPSTYLDAYSDLQLADHTLGVPGPVDLLIGADLFPHVITGRKITISQNMPVALETAFGWVLMGKLNNLSPHAVPHCTSLRTSVAPLEEVVHRFWELENVSQRPEVSRDDAKCEDLFASEHYRLPCGRYSVALPFTSLEPKLVDNRILAVRRLEALERRLDTKPSLKAAYHQFMQDYLESGHMEKIQTPQPNIEPYYYIPHHGVSKLDSSTSKLRVVFDASAKTDTGFSLNDTLFTGPKLQQNIADVLLKFRLHVVVFSADIKQMYRQIMIHPEHRRYQCIVWRSSQSDPIEDFQLNTVTYGVSATPFLAIRTLHQLAKDEGERFPRAAQVILSDTYVDDVVTGADCIDDALALQHEIINLLKVGGFDLRKFSSNEPTLLSWLPAEALQCPSSHTFDADGEKIVKVLGLQWNPVSDTFTYKVALRHNKLTKRAILSDLARIFDPLGWLTPVTFFGKHILQYLWMKGVDWDSPPPAEVIHKWEQLKEELPCLSTLTLPRAVAAHPHATYSLHGFADSSEAGYAAVIYLRVSSDQDETHVYLLVAKSKVAPVKKQSLPRLELCAALLLARLFQSVLRTLPCKIKISNIVAWTDSMVTLAWITSSSHTWKTFVANRVSEIWECIPMCEWRHVPSQDNPADCASRGLSPKNLLHHTLWWSGPPWLTQSPEEWPACMSVTSPEVMEAVNPERRVVTMTNVVIPQSFEALVQRCGRLNKVLRAIVYVRRFIYNCQHPRNKSVGPILPSELNESMLFCLKQVQHCAFMDEITLLGRGHPASARLAKLSPFMDRDGVLRVGGRLSHANLPFDHKHPAILPKRHRFVVLLIAQFHEVNLHPGIQALQGILREKFWILGDRQAIRSCVHKCYKCFRAKPSHCTPIMADLPTSRVQQVKPFMKVGVDYAGPFNITMTRRRGSLAIKAYVCVFVCCTTKAIHIELASDLSTDVFLAAYRRFIARRGRPSDMYSDCGTNFQGARNHLHDLKQLTSSPSHRDSVTNAMSSLGITWHFNPPAAPHFGGLWEAAVKVCKSHLSRVLGEQMLSFEELYTVLVQIEAMLNSRPLCPLSSDPCDMEALTPGHFLTLQPLTTIPEVNLQDAPINRLSRWQLVERIHQDLWSRWHKEYLHTLQQRAKWTQQSPPLQVDCMVLLKEDRLPPLQWCLGRVVSLHPGPDGMCRVATIRTKHGVFKRPVVKLCPLPNC